MPAVQTQQLAFIADLDQGPELSAMVRALSMFDSATKNTYLRRASARVLAAYAKRFARTAGSSFALAKWGDLTIWMTCALARYMLLGESRGFSPDNAGDASIKSSGEAAELSLNEIADITNANARIDPDAVGSPDSDDMGSLASSEGGAFDEADTWARSPYGAGLGLFS